MPRTKVVVKKEDAVGLVEMRRVKLSKLKDAPYNPRTISDEAMDRLERSVEAHGMVVPIIWNERTGNVVGGHQRKKVLERRGVGQVDVVVVNVPLEREKAMNVALNNQFISGDWDLEKLHSLMAEAGDGFSDLIQFPDYFVRDMEKLFAVNTEQLNQTVDENAEFRELGIVDAADSKSIMECPKCGHVFAR